MANKWTAIAPSWMAMVLMTGCAATPAWQVAQRAQLRAHLDALRKDRRDQARLSVAVAGRLDANTIVIGGSFREPAGSIRSCVLLSADNGRSWRDTGVFMDSCASVRLFVLDAWRAWVLVGWSIEGNLPPYYSFATTDGGRTWTRSTVGLPVVQDTGVSYGYGMTFRDARRGEFVWVGPDSRRSTYGTDDAGYTWRLTGQEQILDDEDQLDQAVSALPRQTPTVRARWDDNAAPKAIVVEETADGGKSWRILGQLPAQYAVGESDVAFP